MSSTLNCTHLVDTDIVGRVELRHLRYFVTVAEELSFTRAARVLQMSQPPLSQQISALERELGVRLFERTSRHVELTDSGRVMLREARAILGRATDLRRVAAGAVEGGVEHPLRIGSVPSGFAMLLPAVLPVFRRQHPAVTLLVSALDVAEQVQALSRGQIDIGVLRTVGPVVGLDATTIANEPLVVAMHASHPCARQHEVAVGDLAGDDFIVMPREQGPDYVDMIIATCRSAGFSPRITFEPATDQIMLGLVACGLGVAPVPSPIENLRVPDVIFRPLVGPTPMTSLTLTQATGRPSPYYEVLADLTRTALGADDPEVE